MSESDVKISVHRVEPEVVDEIVERFDLEVKENTGTFWATLEIPLTNAEVTWFRRESDE